MVSNCYTASRRESYVFELQKYIQVDVYGDCINAVSPKHKLLSCPKRLKDECWDMINEKYKVSYLSYISDFEKNIAICNESFIMNSFIWRSKTPSATST